MTELNCPSYPIINITRMIPWSTAKRPDGCGTNSQAILRRDINHILLIIFLYLLQLSFLLGFEIILVSWLYSEWLHYKRAPLHKKV
jgi:hypothetical protein